MTEPEESESSGWELALFHHLTKFKNDLETALRDADSFRALRLRVRDIHSGLVATVRAFAKILGGEKDHADDDDEGISPLHRDEGSEKEGIRIIDAGPRPKPKLATNQGEVVTLRGQPKEEPNATQ